MQFFLNNFNILLVFIGHSWCKTITLRDFVANFTLLNFKMYKKVWCLIEKWVKSQVLNEKGKYQTEISKLVRWSRCVVRYSIKRFTKNLCHESKTRTDKKQITTKRQYRKLIQDSEYITELITNINSELITNIDSEFAFALP